jgi:hypothetical protein
MHTDHVLRIWFEHARRSDDAAQWQAQAQEAHAEVKPTLDALDKVPGDDVVGAYRLTERTCAALLPLLERIRDGRSIAKLQSASMTLAPDGDPDLAEWFAIAPNETMDIQGESKGLIEVRADRIKGRLPLRRYSDIPLASQPFVDFVRGHAMTGIDFIWAPDKGKYAATQWYSVIGTSFVGRGIDHPWFDPATRGRYKYGGFMAVQPTDRRWIIGVREFDAAQTHERLPIASPRGLAELFGLLRKLGTNYGVPIKAPLCLLRAHLPRSDFAYARIAEPTGLEEQPYRTVRLCCTRAARQVLLEARMAQPDDFEPVDVVDEPYAGAAVFDRPAEPLPGVFDEQQLAKVRAAEAKALAKHAGRPKPPMPVNPQELKKLLAKLKRVIQRQEAPLAAGAAADALDGAERALGFRIPARWRELLSMIDGFTIDNTKALDGVAELRVASSGALADEHKRLQFIASGYGELDPPPAHLLGVANSDIGDGIFLDLSRLTPDGDCPVLHLDHETIETVMTWPAIGLFLADAIEVSDDAD